MDDIPTMWETRNLRILYEKSNEDDEQSQGKIVQSNTSYYRLGRLMGKGAYAKVFSCVDINNGCLYAVKEYFGLTSGQESQALLLLNTMPHFGVPQFKECFEFEGKSYLIMYLIAGCSVESVLQNCKLKTEYIPVVPVQLMKTILRQLLVTCRFIHFRGVAHQDIKIDNIYIMDGSRLVLLDFGQAFIMQEQNYLDQAQLIGNLAFMPPEVLINTNIIGSSFQDANQMNITFHAKEKISALIKNNKSMNKSNNISFSDEAKIPRYHHVQTLFDKSRHSISTEEQSQPTKVWINALTRMFKFATPSYDFDNLEIVLNENRQFIDKQLTFSDNYPIQEDIKNIEITTISEKLSREQIHIFNKKLAIDAWQVGINALILLLGEYPFRGLQQYETIPAIQILSASIKQQLDETLQNIVGMNCDFTFYENQINQNKKTQYQIAPGPLPQNIPSDLFLLIAGFLYPNPQVRLTITEALGCPFIEAYQTYKEEQGNLGIGMEPSEKFEPILASLSRMDKIVESSTTINTANSNLSFPDEEPVICGHQSRRLENEIPPMVEDSGTDSDSF